MKSILSTHGFGTRPRVAFFLLAITFSLFASQTKGQEDGRQTLDCLLSATHEPLDDLVEFRAKVVCGTEITEIASDTENDNRIVFSVSSIDTFLVGASLVGDFQGNEENQQLEYDFPVKILRFSADKIEHDWGFTTPQSNAANFSRLIMQVWYLDALIDCPEGRDGCRKYGHALSLDGLLTDDTVSLDLHER